jgi:hypothetical protein
MSYEFGTPEPPPAGHAPLSRLDFSLDSFWHGLEIGIERETWGVHFEWLMPQQGIQGNLADFDFMLPGANFTDLGLMQEQWIEGQMLDLGLEFKLTDRFFTLPIEVWPAGGFRFQRFDIMNYDLVQVKLDNQFLDPPLTQSGNIISFNQQYYVVYLGGQLRSRLQWANLPPVDLTFQGDWGHVEAYNVDHHLIREGDRFTMETTHGDSWHVALTAEMPLNKHFSLGFQTDYMQIRTHGKHQLLNVPEQENLTWDNGVSASADETMLTAFIRLRM